MEIQIAVAKINKYDSTESGDTLEVVERPNGGVSVVLADGQSSGRQAKHISTSVVRKVISLLAEGVRDGAAARAASDALFTERNGESSAFLNILSADFETSTIVITRNNPAPVFVAQREQVECLGSESTAIGLSRNIRPVISEIPLEYSTTIVMYTDGLLNAGTSNGHFLDICTLLESLLEDQEPTAQEIADTILLNAIRMDNDRPGDDMSVVVLRALPKGRDFIRRMSVYIPVPVNEHLY
ncbi:MAG TPA: SpoIIE family protein phosphatase [Levilinea sp.]|nr:SpoIIE family protein phosphatase [Levilinea sp.]